MSVKAYNVGISSPMELRNTDFGAGEYIDASPHIETFRIKMDFSGTRTETVGTITRTETISYTKELEFDRVPYEAGSTAFGVAAENGIIGFDIASPDEYIPSDTTKFRALQPTFGETFGEEPFIIQPYAAKSLLYLFYEMAFADEVCGTWEYTDTAIPANDASGDLLIGSFPNIIFREYTGLYDRLTPEGWGVADGDFSVPTKYGSFSTSDPRFIDITGWDFLDWRQKTGLNTFTIAETSYRTGTTTVEATIEWELS
jgi:hypothetical protein